MPTTSDRLTISLPRTLLFHSRAFHVRRIHATIWLYLAILAVVPTNADTVELKSQDLATAMGLPEGTVRSWLGHLRKYRYLTCQTANGVTRIRVKRHIRTNLPKEPPPERIFTVLKLERALGETGYRKLLEAALASYPDPEVKRALAAALAVPSTEIRRSRTALFLYLLKRHANDQPPDDPRH